MKVENFSFNFETEMEIFMYFIIERPIRIVRLSYSHSRWKTKKCQNENL